MGTLYVTEWQKNRAAERRRHEITNCSSKDAFFEYKNPQIGRKINQKSQISNQK